MSDDSSLDQYVDGATWTNVRTPVIQARPNCDVCHGTGWEPKVAWSHPRAPKTACFLEKTCRKCRKLRKPQTGEAA